MTPDDAGSARKGCAAVVLTAAGSIVMFWWKLVAGWLNELTRELS